MKNVKIYDNGGKTKDRFTAVFMERPERAQSGGFGKPLICLYEALAFDESPFHPLGFGQHTSAMVGRHLGKRILFESLPEKAKSFVLQSI